MRRRDVVVSTLSINLYYARRQPMQKHTIKTNTNYKLKATSQQSPDVCVLSISKNATELVFSRSALELLRLQTRRQSANNFAPSETELLFGARRPPLVCSDERWAGVYDVCRLCRRRQRDAVNLSCLHTAAAAAGVAAAYLSCDL